jgi:hypothetical protein
VRAQLVAEAGVERLCGLGRAAPAKLGWLPLAVSAINVKRLTTRVSPLTSRRLRSNLPASFSKIPFPETVKCGES